ncbi:MAG: 3-hydroxybutyryl-CoA dehydrogenase [Flavobacteriaceae bacterium]|nr:3-hydroxybutyryl-CoA dehydrogenase [Flavobacteriaceae bacterium]|tara:strand:- start:11908 stop:12765 length:858 start_codon:yes stop_codon:yes gene_type:complete
MNNVLVIGSGVMGSGIAQLLSINKIKTTITDISIENLNRSKEKILFNLDYLLKKSVITNNQKNISIKNINFIKKLNQKINHFDLVIEAANEDYNTKKEIFKMVEKKVSPECVLASNTSSISITKIGSELKFPERFIGMHFFNPVIIMKLVEIVKGKETSIETTDKIIELTKRIGKTGIISKDSPGFISNRILMPMINEAIETLRQNVAGVEDIDSVMCLGMAHPMGPLKLADLIGLDVCKAILEVLRDEFNDKKYDPSPLLIKMVNEGKLGRKTKQGFYNYNKNK